MYKCIAIATTVLILSACGTNSNLGPMEKIPLANNSDLEALTDCQLIDKKIMTTKQAIKKYKEARNMNNTSNMLSGLSTILSLGTSGYDYVSNDDFGFDEAIQSREERVKKPQELQAQYCQPVY
ncbi:hypothetical protein PT276_07915 [Orbaceae bacterium ESL0721]|nr:hypothetical protein [Orbaceae bacterium ESL0721]